MTAPDIIKVLICDDHPVVRRGLSALLTAAPDIVVVGTAADGQEAVNLTVQHQPDIVLMDVSMPEMDGMEATRRVIEARPDTRVVMLTSFSGHARIKEALDSGAVGYLLKDSKPEDLLKGIRSAAEASRLGDDV